jgi:DNA helicase MCM8
MDHNQQMEMIYKLWIQFEKRELLNEKKLDLITMLLEFFQSSDGQNLLKSTDSNMGCSGTIYFNVQDLNESLPFGDFEKVLNQIPRDISAVLSVSLSIICNKLHPYLDEPIVKRVAFYNLLKTYSFADIKSTTVNQMISLEGHVVKVAPVRPLVMGGEFRCVKCRQDVYMNFEDGIYQTPNMCATAKCFSRYFEFNRDSIKTIDFQRIKLSELDNYEQKSADSVAEEVAKIPKTFEIELRESLVNTCLAGDIVRIVGMVKVMQVEGTRSYQKNSGGKGGRVTMESGINQFYILGNSITCLKGSGDRRTSGNNSSFLLDSSLNFSTSSSGVNSNRALNFSESELALIERIAYSDENCLPLLVSNFCPMIYGQELVKVGLLLGLFGGSSAASEQEEVTSASSSFKVRTNIHVLVVGDPGLGKSQMLRAAATVAPRSVYVTGNTSTTAGLTVTVSRDMGGSGRQGGELCIEAGALVLADSGICCIDELDKMTSDQHALLEAMEQQSISIAKSGIVTSLRSRTAVFAAANPVGGNYNRRKSVSKMKSLPLIPLF